MALKLLILALAAGSVSAVLIACPTLPALPANATTLALTAGTFNGTGINGTQVQFLAFNSSRGWGPTLRLMLGETYQIDVTNADIQEGTSVHWHGQHLLNSSWADGVAGLTQAPVPAGGTFSHRFQAYPAGTFWYHSHTHAQLGDGLRGALLVEDPADPLKALYDEDSHLILLADVFTTPVAAQLAAMQGMGMGAGGGGMSGGGGSMGGMGGMAMCTGQDVSDAPWYAVEVNGDSFATTGKAAVFTVQQGRRFRFRIVAGTSSWALAVAVQGHNVTLIALDGQPVSPTPAASILLTSGERADVVLHADQPVGNYWINVTTVDGHNSPAILSYEGAPDASLAPNPYTADSGCPPGGASPPGLLDLKSASLAAGEGVPKPPQESTTSLTLLLQDAAMSAPPAGLQAAAAQPGNAYGLSAGNAAELAGPTCPDGTMYCWTLNYVAYQDPPELPIYPAPAAAGQAATASNRSYIVSLQQGDVVDLALVNPSLMVHPMHLHGASFWVLAAGVGDILSPDGRLDPDKLNGPGAHFYNTQDPVLRDTVAVPQAASLTAAMPPTGSTPLTDSSPAPASAGSPAPAGMSPMPGMGMGGGMGGMPGMDMGGGMGRRRLSQAADSVLPGYAVIRFRADNPGIWAFHCHIDLHMASGMMMAFTVAPPAGASWPQPPNLQCDQREAQSGAQPLAPAPLPTSGMPSVRHAVAALLATLACACLALAA